MHAFGIPNSPSNHIKIGKFWNERPYYFQQKTYPYGALRLFQFQKLTSDSNFVITDSGGIQEETTFRRIPCLTLRPNTERPSTITIGTNELVPFDVVVVKEKIELIKTGKHKKGEIPPFWDGDSTRRILEKCMVLFSDELNQKSIYSI
ncbi:MAG: UDP-N-acetylglucosamine 2-epimerase [Bacteroidetes bacterium]|nr:UDP-N-acetylglucosamine 2-epimerase [Bacteroidota bacterium]